MAQIELKDQETVLKEVKGDYWEGSIYSSQISGTYHFTNQRILFHGGFATSLDLPYSEIASVDKCNVGPLLKFMPTGILVTLKSGKKYRLSVLKRKDLIELIQSKL